MRLIAAILLIFTLTACNKPMENPEVKDPIYSDLQTQVTAATAALEGEKKKLEGFEKDLITVVPQTGQIKYAKKRIYESQAAITRLAQEVEYLKLKVEQRKAHAQQSYKKAFAKKEDWPDPKEWTSYQAEQKLRNAKRSWGVKERMKAAGVTIDTGLGSTEGGAEGAKEAGSEAKSGH
ncbi:hypothetical protein [Bdellovibrio sp. HCB288]|uniref:hypothetical protein n=1 Tax=Bdellovibrio sp. HCB288 TaxID=3394355 RepID=UPI0039B6004D